MENELEHSLAQLSKAVAFYFFALALRELLPVLNRLLELNNPQQQSQDNGPPPSEQPPQQSRPL